MLTTYKQTCSKSTNVFAETCTKDFVILGIMSTYAERLTQALELRGVSQSALARQLGVRPQAIQYLCSRGKGSTHTSEIARILGVRSEWLARNDGPMRDPSWSDSSSETQVPLDRQMLVDAVTAAVTTAASQRLSLTPAQMGEYAALIYEMWSDAPNKAARVRPERLLRLVSSR